MAQMPPLQPAVADRRFHFISGLPRSGSTLLSAILRQNPRFHAGMSSPVASLFGGIIDQVSAGTELSRMMSLEQRERLLRGIFDSFYADNPAQVVFDTNRAWTARMTELITLFPNAKVICCARDMAWIMDSLEKQFRESKFENTGLFSNPAERSTVYTRTEALAGPTRLVGYAYQALREACWSTFADRLVIVEYDMLVSRPAEVIKLIYQFLDEPYFDHDFDDVSYEAPVFDEALGLRDLHRVRAKVELTPRRTILPPDVFAKFTNSAFWRDLQDCRAFRIVVKPDAKPDTKEGASTN